MASPSKLCTPIEAIEKRLNDGGEIRPFPTAVSRLLSATKDPRSDSATFAKIIELDAALATRVLRMVNSPLYGMQNEVRTIQQAITLLGQKRLKNLALVYAGAKLMPGTGKTKKQFESLWDHSLGCATVARVLASLVPRIATDDAFLAGIFHDIGKVCLLEVVPDEYVPIANRGGENNLSEEKLLFGMDHTELGLRLSVSWPLPDEIKAVIRYHHSPENDEKTRELTQVVHVANGLARYAGIGSCERREYCDTERMMDLLGLEQNLLNAILEKSNELFLSTKQSF